MRKKERLKQWLADVKIDRIDLAARDRIRQALAPISPAYLRKLLLAEAPGVALDPLVEGVRQDSLDDAERTLCALARAYEREPKLARRLVVEAKDHARLALPRDQTDEARARREEIIAWMVVWVHDPPVFPTWVRLRREAIESRSSRP